MNNTDVQARSNTGLLEDLARLRRYRASLVKTQGLAGYELQYTTIVAELLRRQVPFPAEETVMPTAPRCRLRPLGDHVVVVPDLAEDVTAGGIIVPETAKEKPMQGTVLAVGPGRVEPGIGTVLPSVKDGDRVLFGRYAGTAVTLDDVAVLILREEDCLGILAPEAS